MRRTSIPQILVLAGIATLVLVAGCTGGGSSSGDSALSPPAGFEEVSAPSIPQEGVTVTAYSGSGSAEEALAAFEEAAGEAGWSPQPDGSSSLSVGGGGVAASSFEKDESELQLQVMESDGEVTVLVLQGPKNAGSDTGSGDTDSQSGATPETTSQATPPTSDAEGEEIPDVPRYPDSVRIDYSADVPGEDVDTIATYVAPAGTGEVASFYGEELPGAGWSDIQEFQGGERHLIEAGMDGRSLSISTEPSPDYEGYSRIIVHHTEP